MNDPRAAGPGGPSRGPRLGAVDPFLDQAQVMRDRHRRLAGGCDAVDVGGFEAGIGHRIERRARAELDLRHVGDDSEPGGSARYRQAGAEETLE